MATLDTRRSVTKLQDAGAPEPLATATVDVVEGAVGLGTRDYVTKDYLRAELHRQTVLLGGVGIAIAGVALTIAELT